MTPLREITINTEVGDILAVTFKGYAIRYDPVNKDIDIWAEYNFRTTWSRVAILRSINGLMAEQAWAAVGLPVGFLKYLGVYVELELVKSITLLDYLRAFE